MNDLSTAKIGDLLLISAGFDSDRIIPIERITKTLVIAGGIRLNMRGFVSGGSGYLRTYARLANDSDLFTSRIKSAKRKLTVLTVNANNIEIVESLLLACAKLELPA